eukprot:SAG11_NODE_3146_length_2650_cov_1.956880_4_plen_184_part_00
MASGATGAAWSRPAGLSGEDQFSTKDVGEKESSFATMGSMMPLRSIKGDAVGVGFALGVVLSSALSSLSLSLMTCTSSCSLSEESISRSSSWSILAADAHTGICTTDPSVEVRLPTGVPSAALSFWVFDFDRVVLLWFGILCLVLTLPVLDVLPVLYYLYSLYYLYCTTCTACTVLPVLLVLY